MLEYQDTYNCANLCPFWTINITASTSKVQIIVIMADSEIRGDVAEKTNLVNYLQLLILLQHHDNY